MRAAIFDLDGTLADTAADLVGAMNDLLEAEGLPTTPYPIARGTAGMGGRALIRFGWKRAGRELTEDEVTARFQPFLDAYEARIDHESVLFEGVRETLAQLAEDGWKLGVCTNKPERLARILLERLELTEPFAAILGADTLPVRKPDPRHLLETVTRSGGDPDRSVLIGDSETDRDAARNAGRPIVLVTFGYAQAPIADLAPDAAIDHYDQLIPALETLSL